MDIKRAIASAVKGDDLSFAEMEQVMEQIMTGQATSAQISALLVALRMKSESVDEIAAAATVMRKLAHPVPVNAPYLVDIVGTGGDGANLFNVSTAATFVAAAAGAAVAKHGNRGVSSSSGSADLLQQAGVNLELTPAQVSHCIETVGVGFMFAPQHHGAMKHAIGPRREMGIRTVMNVLGPLTNPANVPNLLVGVFELALCRPLAEVFQRLGHRHVMVVHGQDGLDEITLAEQTWVAELKDDAITEYTLSPESLGIGRQSLDGLAVDGPSASLALIRDALGDQTTANAQKAAHMIALNSGAAIYVAGLAATLKQGVAMAQALIGSKAALARMTEFVNLTQRLGAEGENP